MIYGYNQHQNIKNSPTARNLEGLEINLLKVK